MKIATRLWADIECHQVRWDLAAADGLCSRAGVDLVGTTWSTGKRNFILWLLCFLQELARQVELVFLDQRFADRLALGLEKGIGHAAANDQGVDLIQQIADHANLVADLGAAQDRDKRMLRLFQHLCPGIRVPFP